MARVPLRTKCLNDWFIFVAQDKSMDTVEDLRIHSDKFPTVAVLNFIDQLATSISCLLSCFEDTVGAVASMLFVP